MMDIFQSDDTSLSPVSSGVFTNGSFPTFPQLHAPGAWQDLHGAIRLSVPADSLEGIPIDNFELDAYVPAVGGMNDYRLSVDFKGVPEPSEASLFALGFLSSVLGIVYKRRGFSPNQPLQRTCARAGLSSAL